MAGNTREKEEFNLSKTTKTVNKLLKFIFHVTFLKPTKKKVRGTKVNSYLLNTLLQAKLFQCARRCSNLSNRRPL